MKPYYADEFVTLYHGDCREVQPSIGQHSLVTDPPYGLGERWAGGTWAAGPAYADVREWDSETFDVAVVLAFVADAESAVIWGGNYYALPPTRCWLIWSKVNAVPTMAAVEMAWTNLHRPTAEFREVINPDGNNSRVHPTQKPLSVMEWSLRFAASHLPVFDPFAGSGTTLVAAKNLARRAVGIELNERYCEAAARRLSQSVLDFGGVA